MRSTAPDKNVVKPPALAPGDRIALLCPASRPSSPSLVGRCNKIVEEMGFVPVPGKHVFEVFGGSMAGSDERRIEDLHRAFTDDDIRGIFFVTGGWGSLRLLSCLDAKQIAEKPKVIVGGGDNTALMTAINELTGLVVLNGPNLDQIRERYTFNVFKEAVTERSLCRAIGTTAEPDDLFNAAPFTVLGGSTEGVTAGGNLTALSSLLGTPFQPNFTGKLLLLEDTNEYNGTLDRWLTSLWLAGCLGQTNGIAFGSFENCDGKGSENSLSFEETADDLLRAAGKPSCFGLRFGQSKHSSIVPLGIRARLDADDCRLTFLEPALN